MTTPRARLHGATRFFARVESATLECPHCGLIYQIRLGVKHPYWHRPTGRFTCTNKGGCKKSYVLGIVAWPIIRTIVYLTKAYRWFTLVFIGGIDMAKAHSEKSSSYCVETDYGTFHVCYGCKLLGHCPPAKGSAGYVGHPLHDARGCQCEHASHFDGSEEEIFAQAVEGALNAAARRLGAE